MRQAGAWLADAGYVVEEVEPPSLAEAHELWKLIANDEARQFMWPAIEQFGDEGVRRSFGWMLADSPVLDHAAHLRAFAKRSTLLRRWQLFLERLPAGAGPGVGRAALPLGLGRRERGDEARVLRAQESQFAVPVLGLPAVSVPTGLAGALPMGVQLIGPRFREDLVLDAAEVIEARCPPMTPIDPR